MFEGESDGGWVRSGTAFIGMACASASSDHRERLLGWHLTAPCIPAAPIPSARRHLRAGLFVVDEPLVGLGKSPTVGKQACATIRTNTRVPIGYGALAFVSVEPHTGIVMFMCVHGGTASIELQNENLESTTCSR